MTRLVRVLLVALIAVVTAWTIGQAANAMTISRGKVAMTAHCATDESHSHLCELDGTRAEAGLLCHLACASPALLPLTDRSDASMPVCAVVHGLLPPRDLR